MEDGSGQDEGAESVEEKDKGGGQFLDTIPGVRRSMATALIALRGGKLKPHLASVLLNGYAQLARLMQDERDHEKGLANVSDDELEAELGRRVESWRDAAAKTASGSAPGKH